MHSKKIINTIKLLFLAGVIYWLFQTIEVVEVIDLIKTTRPLYLLLFCSLYPVSVWLSTTRWNQILNQYYIQVPLATLYTHYWQGSFLSSFLPTDFGGDVYKFLSLKKGVSKRAQLISSIFLDRFFGLLAMLAVICVTGWYWLEIESDFILLLIFVSSLVCLIVSGLLLILRTSFKFDRISKLEVLTDVVSLPVSVILKCFLLSIVFVIQTTLAHWLIFQSLGTSVPFGLLLFLVPVVNLTGVLPLTPSGIGIKEGVGVFIFSMFGLNAALCLSAMILVRALLLLTSAFGIFCFWCLRVFQRQTRYNP